MKYTIALKNLPFEPSEKQIIFVENGYDEVVNKFIADNYKHICMFCEQYGYQFCYMPKLAEEVVSEEVLLYNAPYANIGEEVQALGSDFLLQFMLHPENKSLIPPSLLYFKADPRYISADGTITFLGMSITDQEVYPQISDIFFQRLRDIILERPEAKGYTSDSHDRVRFSDEESVEFFVARESSDEVKKELLFRFRSLKMMLNDETEELGCYDEIERLGSAADYFFDEESKQIADEIRERIKLLEQRTGIEGLPLIVRILNKEKLSRLHITRDFRIFLPDYNNMEIEMTPLPKAVFILFLRHPDGIAFKCLPDYREELKEIYLKMKPAGWTAAVEHSIKALTDPFDNSINEKCARIREAFLGKFKEHLAENYFVTGKRGEPKKITLPRELVTWEK